MQVTFDLDNPNDRARVRKLLDEADRVPSADALDQRALERQVRELLQGEQYGDTRRRLVRLIATASPRTISKEQVYRAAAEINAGRTQNLAVGGLHSSLERSWKRVGGVGKFFETSSAGFTMRPEIASTVLKVLDEWDQLQRQ